MFTLGRYSVAFSCLCFAVPSCDSSSSADGKAVSAQPVSEQGAASKAPGKEGSDPAEAEPVSAIEALKFEPWICNTSKTRKAPGVSPRTAASGHEYLEVAVDVVNPTSGEITFDGFATVQQGEGVAPQDTSLIRAMAKGGSDYRRFARPTKIGPESSTRAAWIFVVAEDTAVTSMEIRESSNTHKWVIDNPCR